MKKLFTIAVAATMMCAAASQASAAALETKGEYRGRYWFLSNYTAGGAVNPVKDEDYGFWDQRFRLGMGWQVSETVKVDARADILENTWDFTTGTNDKQEIDFDWMKVSLGLGGANKLELGKMDVSWGLGVYAKADNRYRARYSTKFNNVGVGLAYDMITESTNTENLGDDEAITLGAAFPVGAHTFGILGIYQSNKSKISSSSGAAMPNTDKLTLWGIDGYWTGAFGAAKVNAEAAYATATFDNVGVADQDADGIMAYVGVNMPVGPIGLGLEFGYATGDKPGTADNEGLLSHDYNGPFNSFILFNNFDLNGYNSVYSGGVDRGLNNAMAFKASGTFAASKQLSFMGAAVWAEADQPKVANGDTDLGIEVDLLAKYALTENVTLQAGFGWLAVGDFYGANQDDPYVATAHAIVTF